MNPLASVIVIEISRVVFFIFFSTAAARPLQPTTRAQQFVEQLPRELTLLAGTGPPGYHGVRRACSGGAPPQGLVSVLLRFRSPGSLAPPR